MDAESQVHHAQGGGAAARTKRIAVLVNALVESIHPRADLQTFSQTTRTLLENVSTTTEGGEVELKRSPFTAARSPAPTSTSIAQNLLKSHGQRASELFSTLSRRDAEVARKLTATLMKLAEGRTEATKEASLLEMSSLGSPGGSILDPRRKREEASANVEVLKSKENEASREKRIQAVKDFLSALQGVKGHFLRQKTEDQVLTRGELAILENALELGKLQLRVRTYASRLITEKSSGLVCQRLGHALRDELDGFDRFLSILEDNAFRDDASGVRSVHLAQLHAWSEGILRRLEMLVRICEATEALRGGALVSALYAQTCLGNPAHRELANRLLYKAFVPVEEICRSFLETGRLQLDSYSEFFVTRRRRSQATTTTEDGGMTVYEEFELVDAMVPTFLGREFALQVLSTGCESKTARKLGPEEDEERGKDDESAISSSDEETGPDRPKGGSPLDSSEPLPGDAASWYLRKLQRFVDRMERKANESILSSLFKEHHLRSHLLALKQFLLLGQGDFGQLLVELTASALNRPIEDVSRMELLSHLEHAVQFSNAVQLPEDVLARLDIKLLEEERENLPASAGRIRPVVSTTSAAVSTWDAFTLDYLVDFPLNLVITDRSRKKYRRIFRFLWRVKRVQYELETIWKTHASLTRREDARNEEDAEDFGALNHLVHRCHLVRAEMVHFVTNLRSYVMFEVLETSWEQFVVDLGEGRSLAELIEAHDNYLKSVLLKAMVVDDEDDEEADTVGDDSVVEPIARSLSASISPALLSTGARKFRPSVSKSPIFSLRTSDVTYKETKGLSLRLDNLFELMLRFCALQVRLFSRIREHRQALALKRRKRRDAERRRAWLASSGATPSKIGKEFPSAVADDEEAYGSDDDDNEEEQTREIATEFQSQVETISTEFWQALNAFLSSLKACSSENLRFLGLRLNFNRFY